MVGEVLKKRREELGLDLKEISERTKIRYCYLKALEDEAFEKLPAQVFVRGYIREYAKVLDINPETVIDVYNKQVAPPEKTKVPQTEVSPRKRLRLHYLLILLLSVGTVASLVLILFLFSHEKPKTLLHSIETKKEEVQRKDAHHTLEIVALDTTWIRVNIDGTDLKEMLLNPKESVTFDAKNSFSLKIGNAGGIILIFDGRDMGPPGKKGQVITLDLPPSRI